MLRPHNSLLHITGILLSCIFSFYASADSRGFSLQQIYNKTLQKSESLQITAQDIRVAQAQYEEAISAIYPQLHLKLFERIRDNGNANSTQGNNSGTGSGFVGTRDDRFQAALNVTQPLFSGFRDFLLADAAEYEIAARQKTLERQRELLYQDVAELFYQALLYQRDISEIERTESVLKERIKELGEFVKLGKSKDSESISAQADLTDASVTKVQVQGLLNATKELLAFLTGIPSAQLLLADTPPLLKIEGVEYYVSLGKDRSDIKALDQRVRSTEKQVTAAERERWPSLSLEGNYYPVQSPDNNQNADVLFMMDLPLFEGGRIDARVEQQKALQTSTKLQRQQLERTAEKEVRVAYANFEQSRSEKSQLKKLVATTQKNYESQKKDYSLGVVTNLEVLQAIQQLQNAKRRLLKASIDEQVNRVKLLVAAGSAV